jgi:alpha-beta hydrolase superfamily lysophospholipase
LQKELLIRGYETQTPEMPRAYEPEYGAWRQEFERHPISKRTLLVGHSCGGGFLLRWLSEHPQQVARLVLVAPWMDPNKNHCVQGFFDFEINRELIHYTDLHFFNSLKVHLVYIPSERRE